MSNYKDKIKKLPRVTLDEISKVCRDMLPEAYKERPWLLPYGDKNYAKIFDKEDELNGYAAAYTNWHKGKLRIAFDHTPSDTFVGEIAVIDWACGQGLATIFLHEYLEEIHYNCRIKEVILVEPSEKALNRAKFNIEAIDNKIKVSTVNKKLDEVIDFDIKLFEKRKVIHLFSNIFDIQGISLKHISENLLVNLSKDNYVLCVSPYYQQVESRYNTLLQYFQRPLVWQFRDSQSQKNVLGYTYNILSLKFLADKAEQIIKYDYFPASQFRACFALECVKPVVDDFGTHTYLDVYAPYELGANISDDVEPIFAVLNNIVSRGLPTKPSLKVEKTLSEKLSCSEVSTLYGGFRFNSLLNHADELKLKEYAKTECLGEDLRINQLLYTPIAIARVHKVFVEALISYRLNLQKDEWNILIEECDVPFAKLAVEDFKEMFNHLAALSQDFDNMRIPHINLHVISSKVYKDSPLLEEDAIFDPTEEIRNTTFDLVIRYSSTPKTKDCNFTEYQVNNDSFYCIFPATERYAERYIYTTDRLDYYPLIQEENKPVDESVKHLRYFLQLLFRKVDFRPGQLPILSRVLQNKSVIGLLPTGGGKSLTYQLAAFLQPGISLVIDPLVSLMKDQYDGLINAGIDCCTYINSQVYDTRAEREYDMEHSKCLFVFMSPERLCIHGFRQRLRNMQDLNVYFAYGVIDEVHCVSEWGHDFRFSYLHLGRNLYQYVLPKQTSGHEHISLLGLTATASFDVLADVERELSGEGAFPLDNDAVVRYENTNRLELQYRVVQVDASGCNDKWDVYERKNDMAAQVLCDSLGCLKELEKPENIKRIKNRFLQRENIMDDDVIDEINERNIAVTVDKEWATSENGNASAIVFCPHRVGSLGVNDSAKKRGVKSAIAASLGTQRVSNYVGGDELTEQDRFLHGDTNIMVATKAFGMGIDKPNVRFTLNINHSGSLEGYVQEAGRAGRDRKMALSTIMYCPQEFSEQNERTRIYETVPVDYGVHQFFYENNFIGADFEKWIMYFLMSKNTNTILEVGEEQKNVESVSGFLDKLMSAQLEEELIYYISYTYTTEDVRWINEMLTKNNLPRFKTDYDLRLEEEGKRKYGFVRPAYNYGYADYTEALQKAIYRMCCVGVIDDFTQDYYNQRFRIVTKRKADGHYFMALKQFLKRYYTDERADIEIAKAHEVRGYNEIQQCLSFITEFVYCKIAMKRKRAMQDMEDFCNRAVHSTKNWLEINEDLKDDIYYYFNSKYARDDYETELGESFSLAKDTDHGKYSSFDILFKYLRVVDDDVMGSSDSQIGNIKHLHGAVRLIRRSLTDTNPTLDMLNAYCLLFLGVGDNKNLANEMRDSYINAYKEFRERNINNIKDFYTYMKHFKEEIQKKGRNVVDEKEMMLINGWEAEAELIIHSSWIKMFRAKFVGSTKDNVQSSKK
ncbi:MAG: DEAD/DEAH box helicase [Bacteroides sp.]|nr:DEAD/DEAH box helicase [Roseburia sp.]MCM1345793.1 DEAD/DEAH box helicase [Bacteroides sp.]MCM1420521.1 DEAD/DEAH box helicase [Bacteroides sp.]